MSNPTIPQLLADRIAEGRVIVVKNDAAGYDIAVIVDGGYSTKTYAESIVPFWRDVVTRINESRTP